MFGPRLSSIFKSRWIALLWAALVLWMAVDFVGVDTSGGNDGNEAAVGTDVTGQPVTDGDIAALKHVLEDH